MMVAGDFNIRLERKGEALRSLKPGEWQGLLFAVLGVNWQPTISEDDAEQLVEAIDRVLNHPPNNILEIDTSLLHFLRKWAEKGSFWVEMDSLETVRRKHEEEKKGDDNGN